MMLHSEEDDLVLADQVEHQIVVHYEFAQIVSFVEEFAQIFSKCIRFRGLQLVG